MADTTHISWADMTFNPWVGCTKVGPACDGCYAEHLMATRHKRVVWGAPGVGVGTRDRTSTANWVKPLAWDRKAAADGARPFVFCSSLADVFDSDVPLEWRADLFDLIRRTPNLVWLLLTKRPGNIVRLFDALAGVLDDESYRKSAWPRNAAIGCTVVTQAEADRDIPKLLTAKAMLKPAFAFVSMEPLLGPVDLTRLQCSPGYEADVLRGEVRRSTYFRGVPSHTEIADRLADCHSVEKIDWVITGGETDQGSHKARPSHPDWFRDIRDQCAAASVAYHHKQNGEWAPGECSSRLQTRTQLVADWSDGGWLYSDMTPAGADLLTCEDEPTVWRLGKADAGRWLDGVIHDARPEPTS